MAEKFNDSGANFVSPGSFNPHHENGNLGQGSNPRDKMVRFDGNDPEADPNLEAMIANRNIRAGESFSTIQVAAAETPLELFTGLRAIENHLEDGNIPSALEDRYGATRLFGMVYERSKVLRYTPQELIDKGWINNYDEKTGTGLPKNANYSSLALSIETIPQVYKDKDGRVRQGGVDFVYNFGTPEQRAEMAKACEMAVLEFETRTIMGEQVGLRLNAEVRDGLETLVVALRSGRMPKFKPAHLKAAFNFPSVSEIENNPENRLLGDQIEQAMLLNLIMLASGTKQRMIDLLKKPGSKYLIAKMAKEEEDRRGGTYTYDNWIADNIGDYHNWVDDNKRELDTFIQEAKDGLRKRLTEFSNISAFEGDFGDDDETKFIEKTVGKIVGSVEAAWLAATMMKVIGAYASEGYVALPNGESRLPLGSDHFMSGDDTGKFWAYMQVLKEGIKGRASGLKDMIGNTPDMAMNLFDWAMVKVQLPNGKIVRRSIWDAWLGTAGGEPIKDILTLEDTGKTTTEEGYHRLGDLKFDSLPKDFHAKFATMQWLMGNAQGPTGVLNEMLRTDFKGEDFTLNSMKKVNKYVRIVMNPIILTRGSIHKYDVSKFKILQTNFMRNLMKARIRSYSFATSILASSTEIFNPLKNSDKVPNPVLIRENVFEVLKNSPKNEEELKAHYIDENKKLRTLGKNGTVGGAKEIDELTVEEFLPVDKNEQKFVQYTGRVTGKNTF